MNGTLSRASLASLAGVALLTLWCIAPIAWLVLVSVVDEPGTFLAGQGAFTLAHFREVLGNPDLHILDYARNTVLIATITAATSTVLAALAAYAIARFRFRGRLVLPVLILAVSLFPPIAIVGDLFERFADLGWLNHPIAVILPHIAMTLPLSLWILVTGFGQIPPDLDRAARIDGASRVKILFTILLPLAGPSLAASFLLAFIASCNEFLFAAMLTIDHQARTLTVGIAQFQGTYGELPWGQLMAVAALTGLSLVVLTVLCQRLIVSGLSAGAIKG